MSGVLRVSSSGGGAGTMVLKLRLAKPVSAISEPGLVEGAHAPAHARAHQDGHDVEGERQQEQHEDRGIKDWARLFDVGRLGRKDEDVIPEIHELVVKVGGKRG